MRTLECQGSGLPGTGHGLAQRGMRNWDVRLLLEPDGYRLDLGRDPGRPGEKRGVNPGGLPPDGRGLALLGFGHRLGQRRGIINHHLYQHCRTEGIAFQNTRRSMGIARPQFPMPKIFGNPIETK